MTMIEEHVEKMKGMTCAEKTRYVLEFVLHQQKPFCKSKYRNKVYHYFYRNMHYQKCLENARMYMNNRAIREGKKPHAPNLRLRIPAGFDSQSEFRRYVAEGIRHLSTSGRAVTRHEAFRAGLTVHVGAENRKYDKIPGVFRQLSTF